MSRFLMIKCSKCKNKQVVFEKSSSVVKCLVCGNVLARPTGGKVVVESNVIETLK